MIKNLVKKFLLFFVCVTSIVTMSSINNEVEASYYGEDYDYEYEGDYGDKYQTMVGVEYWEEQESGMLWFAEYTYYKGYALKYTNYALRIMIKPLTPTMYWDGGILTDTQTLTYEETTEVEKTHYLNISGSYNQTSYDSSSLSEFDVHLDAEYSSEKTYYESSRFLYERTLDGNSPEGYYSLNHSAMADHFEVYLHESDNGDDYQFNGEILDLLGFQNEAGHVYFRHTNNEH